ncbi:hypothetical protein NEPAR06_0315 [Nematocida parisii]|nr:hypothetical protein NEPAR06_0315 [Nematocida parisii]KAI5156065.1 hypothetical protein NEPAR05_0275 [Nematocida parisii]
MRANDLLEIEERISNLLSQEEKKRGERTEMLKQIQVSIEKRRTLCSELEKEKQKRIDNLNKQKEALKKAKIIALNKENEEIKEKKEQIRKEYIQAIENVNRLELVLSKDMPATVKKIVLMGKEAKKSGFKTLSVAITEHLSEEIRKFIVQSKKVSSNLRVDKLIDLIKGLNRSIALCEDGADKIERRREMYLDGLFADVVEGFTNHFFSQFETNRLDKPEWYLDYLKGIIAEHETIFSVLSQIDELETEEGGIEESVIKEKYFHGLIDWIYGDIIYKKLNECIYSSSKQQKKLIMHHAEELSLFERELFSLYKYKRIEKIPKKEADFIENLFICGIENELHGIMKKDYTQWSDMFMYLLKTTFKKAAALYSIIPDAHAVLLEAAIKKYLDGLTVFLNSFLYQKTEEQAILVHFIEEISHLEEELIDIETEFGILVGEVTILNAPYLGEFKNSMLDILERVLEEKVERAMGPFTDYRFMEKHEEVEALSNLEEVIESELALIETQTLSDWMRSSIAALIDRYISENVLLDSIGEEADVNRAKDIFILIIEILKKNGIQDKLVHSKRKCQELSANLHKVA